MALFSSASIYGTANVNSSLTVTAGIASTSNSTGSVIVTGGTGISGNVVATKIYSNSVDLLNYSQAAFDKANSVTASLSYQQGIDNTQNTNISNANTYVSGVYNQSNTAGILQQASYDKSNTAASDIVVLEGVESTQNTNIANIETKVGLAYQKANDSISLAQAAFNYSNGTTAGAVSGISQKSNVAIGLAQPAFNKSNTGASDIASISTVNASQNSYILAIDAYITAGYDLANTASLTSIDNQAAEVTQNTNIQNLSSFTQNVYAAANTLLSNTGGTIAGSVTINQNLSIEGNLSVTGAKTTLYNESLSLGDSLIYLGANNYYSDTDDIGFFAHHNPGTNTHAGLVRTSIDREYYVFDAYDPEVTSNNNIYITDPSFSKANINASYFKGNVIAATVLVNGINEVPHLTSAYSKANSFTTLAQAAYNKSNTGASDIIAIQNVNSIQDNNISSLNTYIGSSYNKSNTSSNNITVIQGINLTQNTGITYIETLAQAVDAYTNSELAEQNTAVSFETVTLNNNNLIISGNVSINSTSTLVDSFSSNLIKSAKYLIQMTYGSDYHVMECRVMTNGLDGWLTVYGDINTNSVLGTIGGELASGVFNLTIDPVNNGTIVKFQRSSLK